MRVKIYPVRVYIKTENSVWDSQTRNSNKTFFNLHEDLCESDFILMSTSDNVLLTGFMAVPLIERQSGNNYPNVQLMI